MLHVKLTCVLPHAMVHVLQVLVLLQEKAQLNAQHAQMMQSKEAEMRRLQQHISTELQQLKQRQMEASSCCNRLLLASRCLAFGHLVTSWR